MQVDRLNRSGDSDGALEASQRTEYWITKAKYGGVVTVVTLLLLAAGGILFGLFWALDWKLRT